MRSSSLKFMKEAGIKNARAYRDSIIHDWFLSEDIKEKLEVFFQAKEYSNELNHHIKDGAFIIGTKEYQITWIHKPDTIYKSEFAILSFRYCKYLNCGYVLIKELTGNEAHRFNFVEYPEDSEFKGNIE